MVTLQSCCMALTLAASLLTYLNTLPAGFAFDDNFAVVREPQVTWLTSVAQLRTPYLACQYRTTL